MAEEGAPVQAEVSDHLRDARDVVVAAADEGDEGFPGRLVEDADAGEGWGAAPEVGVCGGPVGVEGGEGVVEVEVGLEEGLGVVWGGWVWW